MQNAQQPPLPKKQRRTLSRHARVECVVCGKQTRGRILESDSARLYPLTHMLITQRPYSRVVCPGSQQPAIVHVIIDEPAHRRRRRSST